MLTSFAKIEANKALLAHMTIPPQVVENIQRQSLLKSSLFSAKIEGNSLTLAQVDELEENPQIRERIEVANLLRTLSFLRHSPQLRIERDVLLDIHTKVMQHLLGQENLGKLRHEPSAIFDSSGYPIYIPPPPSEVPLLIEQLIQFMNSDTEKIIPIKAIVSHFMFEKIHPFLDGNGRVGRLLLQMILATGEYHFQWLLSFEELLNERKSEYYAVLEEQEATACIELMLSIFVEASDLLITSIAVKEFSPKDLLLPRRQEILQLISEHTMMSLESIKRRFLQVPERTLRYDLQQLEKDGFIYKVGTTRGALYRVRTK